MIFSRLAHNLIGIAAVQTEGSDAYSVSPILLGGLPYRTG
jgi:hypothetical protein